jgi:hypothetical protein
MHVREAISTHPDVKGSVDDRLREGRGNDFPTAP